MKIGFCMLLWTTEVTAAHETLLRDIKAAGYDGVEIPIFTGTVEDYAATARMLDRIGLERTAIAAMGDPAMNPISPDAEVRARGLAHLKWTIDCAAALGAPTLSGPLHSTLGFFTGEGPTADERARCVSFHKEVADYAAAKGVTIGLEALNRFECYLFNLQDDLSAHCDAVGHPNIKAMYDTFHTNIEENDAVAAFERNTRHIVHIHISENNRGVPGRGHVPWERTFRAIRKSGYDGWLTIEAFGRALPDLAAATKIWRDLSKTPDEVYRDGIAHIRDGWARAA